MSEWEIVITTALPSDHKHMQDYLDMIEQNPIDIACDDGQNTVVVAAAGAAAMTGGLVWSGRDANQAQPVLMFCNDVNWGTKTRHKVSSMCDLMLPPGSELWCARLDSRTSAQPCCHHHSLSALTRFRSPQVSQRPRLAAGRRGVQAVHRRPRPPASRAVPAGGLLAGGT